MSRVEQSNRKKKWNDLWSAAQTYGASAIIIVGVIALWQFGIPEGMSSALPKPTLIAATIWKIWPILLDNVLQTALEAVLGFALGTTAGVLIAIGFVYSRTVAKTVYPIAVVLRSLPLIALMPFLVSLFGTGIMSKVVLAALTCFFPTLVNMVQGLTSVEPQALELMQTLNASEKQVFWKLRLPYSLPFLFTSFKITSSAAVLGAIIGEWLWANVGLGAFIVNAMFNMQGPELWASMMVATALSILAYTLAAVGEAIIVPWQATRQKAEAGR
jgi:NitT/TauT family transport system permease protein